eukprot:6191348-Pleurochrysis_carterae.AAC.1
MRRWHFAEHVAPRVCTRRQSNCLRRLRAKEGVREGACVSARGVYVRAQAELETRVARFERAEAKSAKLSAQEVEKQRMLSNELDEAKHAIKTLSNARDLLNVRLDHESEAHEAARKQLMDVRLEVRASLSC